MKKRIWLATLCCSGIMALTVQAEININWFNEFGYVPNRADTGGMLDEGIGILDASVNPGQDVYMQLIFTPDMVIDQAYPMGALAPGGNDVTLATTDALSFPNVNMPYADSVTAFPVTAPFQSGFVYARIFDTTMANIALGDWYYDGPLLAVTDVIPPLGIPQEYGANLNTLPGGFGDELTLPVVPEPSTLALLGIGLGTILYRRRRNS